MKENNNATELTTRIENLTKAIFTPLFLWLWGIASVGNGEKIGFIFLALALISSIISIVMLFRSRDK